MLRKNVTVDGAQGLDSREAECEDVEVALETRVNGETTSSWVHARQVLSVVDILDAELGSVIPMTVVDVLAHQSVRFHGKVLVYLYTYQIDHTWCVFSMVTKLLFTKNTIIPNVAIRIAQLLKLSCDCYADILLYEK